MTGICRVVSAYAVAIGGFRMLGGRACDLFGRRRILVASLVLYATSWLLGGLTSNAATVIAARAIQGVGGALLFPSTLALINALFEEGSARNRALAIWGGAGDVVVKEHWGQSGFANTDLDFQLKQHGITHVVTVGLLANTCIESTSRFAIELGYHVTLVRDATAALNHEFMHAAHDLNEPTFAHATLTTPEPLAPLPRRLA